MGGAWAPCIPHAAGAKALPSVERGPWGKGTGARRKCQGILGRGRQGGLATGGFPSRMDWKDSQASTPAEASLTAGRATVPQGQFGKCQSVRGHLESVGSRMAAPCYLCPSDPGTLRPLRPSSLDRPQAEREGQQDPEKEVFHGANGPPAGEGHPLAGPAGCTVALGALGLGSAAEKPLRSCICWPACPSLVQNCWGYVCRGDGAGGGSAAVGQTAALEPSLDLCGCPHSPPAPTLPGPTLSGVTGSMLVPQRV